MRATNGSGGGGGGLVSHELLMVMSGMGVNGTIKRDISGYEEKKGNEGKCFAF